MRVGPITNRTYHKAMRQTNHERPALPFFVRRTTTLTRGVRRTTTLTLFVEQLHSRVVFWRIRGGPPGGGAGGAGGAAAVGLGDSWKRGTDNPHDLELHSRGWRIRGGPPGGAAAAAGAPAAVGLGNSWLRGADNPHDVVLWRIRMIGSVDHRPRPRSASGPFFFSPNMSRVTCHASVV